MAELMEFGECLDWEARAGNGCFASTSNKTPNKVVHNGREEKMRKCQRLLFQELAGQQAGQRR
jgi:hypothetical protein